MSNYPDLIKAMNKQLEAWARAVRVGQDAEAAERVKVDGLTFYFDFQRDPYDTGRDRILVYGTEWINGQNQADDFDPIIVGSIDENIFRSTVQKNFRSRVSSMRGEPANANAAQTVLDKSEAFRAVLQEVERWMSGYGTTPQRKMRERVREVLAAYPAGEAAQPSKVPDGWDSVKVDSKPLLEALEELVRCVRGGDRTAGVSMDDALLDADDAIAEAKAASAKPPTTEKAVRGSTPSMGLGQ